MNKTTHLSGRLLVVAVAILVVAYVLLLIPEASPTLPDPEPKEPFAWRMDAYFDVLEAEYVRVRELGCDSVRAQLLTRLDHVERQVRALDEQDVPADHAVWLELETALFELAPRTAVCYELLPRYQRLFNCIRRMAKRQSREWDMDDPPVRHRLYRLLYGGRAALEEVLLQVPDSCVTALDVANPEPCATPSAELLGTTIHSGDLLVSRGGAPTSALIARGNDFPGNFSHVALAHVDSAGDVSIIEAHIECGVKVATLDDYLRDKKLRVMVLRLRRDLPVIEYDSLFADMAADLALQRARDGHTAYDFAMDFDDNSTLFCSEVASAPYKDLGLRLWMGLSHISRPGTREWLGAFGVRNFTTQAPSDLEYDPQLTVVAEWRDPETLFQDHVDNAVIDVLLDEADNGLELDYEWYKLPVARLMKAYSSLVNQFGGVGPVPEGMSATSALRNNWFSKQHAAIKGRLLEKAKEFEMTRGYRPPYWELISMAQEVVGEQLGTS
ncbi:MAG: hypothetical protein KKA42_14635 [candidate division Zixibacteria bacterium]|nr:hypothetical protein [candidate division Zixibacteria bacterium]